MTMTSVTYAWSPCHFSRHSTGTLQLTPPDVTTYVPIAKFLSNDCWNAITLDQQATMPLHNTPLKHARNRTGLYRHYTLTQQHSNAIMPPVQQTASVERSGQWHHSNSCFEASSSRNGKDNKSRKERKQKRKEKKRKAEQKNGEGVEGVCGTNKKKEEGKETSLTIQPA